MNGSSDSEFPLVLAMTGASGAVYGVRLLQALVRARVPIHLVTSPSALEVLAQELKLAKEQPASPHFVRQLLQYRYPNCEGWVPFDAREMEDASSLVYVFDHGSYLAPMASGSFRTRGMVVVPCSGSTLSGIVQASGNNLIVRAADVHLKEKRKLILVNRETPLSVFQLENMLRAAQAGAIVLPAMPGWYHGVTNVLDLIDFVVARILDHLEIPHNLIRRWGGNTSL